MTFSEFVSATFRLPATILGGMSTLIFGDYDRHADGTAKKKGVFNGLLGLVLEFGKAIGRTVTDFLKSHAQAIASAFWLSLLVGGAAALTVAYLPAALAAVTAFSIAGYSIASVVGTGFIAQVGATAAVAAALTSASVYAVATVANVINFICGCCVKKGPANDDGSAARNEPQEEEAVVGSATALSHLGRPAVAERKTAAAVVANTAMPANSCTIVDVVEEDARDDYAARSSMC